MRLLVDLGNSRSKWAWQAEDGALQGPYGLARTEAGEFERAWALLAPRDVIFCSVANAGSAAALRRWAQWRWDIDPVEIRAQAQLGAVRSAYGDPASLGADRWASLLGARALLGAADAVIVDAGTAVTVDGLRADGTHVGGAIFAGLAAARAGLAAAAPALPASHAHEHPALPASDTLGALTGGTWQAHVGACERVAHAVGAVLDDPAYLLTGGDGAALAAELGRSWHYEALLIMRGLCAAREAQCAG